MDEPTDALEEAGAWYVGVLAAVEVGLHAAATGMPSDAAPAFVASLARQGYMIERDQEADSEESE